MLEEGLNSAVVRTKNRTRENFIVFDNTTEQEYRFGMPERSYMKMNGDNADLY
jgi:fructose-1-phosphate kinase PfkB-like protein